MKQIKSKVADDQKKNPFESQRNETEYNENFSATDANSNDSENE